LSLHRPWAATRIFIVACSIIENRERGVESSA
jgi:hypothetical protein